MLGIFLCTTLLHNYNQINLQDSDYFKHVFASKVDNNVGPDLRSQLIRPHSAVRNMSDYRCISECRCRGREFYPASVPYFRRLIMKSFLLSLSSLPLVVSYKQKYVHKVLVNCLFKLAQEKVWLGELTVRT